jgi:hypothetical protein
MFLSRRRISGAKQQGIFFRRSAPLRRRFSEFFSVRRAFVARFIKSAPA